MEKSKFNPDTLRKYRKSLRESQYCFWSRFGVTQSRGSRFEMGTAIPQPVAILLQLYFDGIITDDHLSSQLLLGDGAARKPPVHMIREKSIRGEWL
jgi:RsaL-like HTH domain